MALALAPSPGFTSEEFAERLAVLMHRWLNYPGLFLTEALGADPDPWQCDVLDALQEEDNVALRACHGVGKTATMSWATLHFTMLRPMAKCPTTAPTFNKQVRDVLWSEIHKWFRAMEAKAPWLAAQFELTTTRLVARRSPAEWFAVGIASNKPINAEGYHAPHLLALFDEAKGIMKPTWDAIHGMRTTQEAKFLVGSTPGGPLGEFFNVFTKYRQTWKRLFIIHPLALKAEIGRPEAVGTDPVTGDPVSGAFAKGGTYYSARVRPEWIEERRLEWGADSPVFIARARGDFPVIDSDVLIPYTWLVAAESREVGATGERWVACDVARYGRDRTIAFVMDGGTAIAGESIARLPGESTAEEVHTIGVGDDPKRPAYRSTVATADMCQRLRRQHGCAGIALDDTGLGGGVTDELKARGEKVLPVLFGGGPTDRPRTPEEAKRKRARGMPETHFFNLKAQMGWALRSAFEVGHLALGLLPDSLLNPLIAQCSLIRQEMTPDGRIRILDPDQYEEDEWATMLGGEEVRRSPDHFHALLIGWWVGGTAARLLIPQAQSILPGHAKIVGRPRAGSPGTQPLPQQASPAQGRVGGPAAYLGGLYRGR